MEHIGVSDIRIVRNVRQVMHKHTKEFEELKRTVKKLEQTIEKMNDRLQSVEHICDEFFKSLEELELLIDEIELETGHEI